jgi:hypothetical protein
MVTIRPAASGSTASCARALATRQVPPETGIVAGRVLRRWHRVKGLTKQVTVARRVEQTTGRVYYRRSRKRKRLFAHNRGFASSTTVPPWPPNR